MIKLLTHRQHRNFLRLWLAQLISQFGDRIHQMALVGLVAKNAPGSVTQLATIMAFTIIPVFVVQPFAGVFVDRWDRRTTLFICDLARGTLVLLIPLVLMPHQLMQGIYAVVFFVFCFSRFYVPAKMSIIPDLIGAEDLLKANSLVTTTGMIASVLGFGVGAVMIEQWGARQGFFLDAGTFFLSALLLFQLRSASRKTAKYPSMVGLSQIGRDMKEGYDYLIQHKDMRFVLQTLFMLLAAAGAVYVVIIAFIQEAFGSVTKDIGILTPCLGAGLFVGSLIYGKWGKAWDWKHVIYTCLFVGGIMLLVFTQVVTRTATLMPAMGLAFLLGLVIGPIFVAANTLTHLFCHDHMRGKVFSALEIVIHLAFLVAMLLSAWCADFFSITAILTTVACLLIIVGFLNIIRSRPCQRSDQVA